METTTAAEPFKTEQEKCWELGGEVLDQGAAHPSLGAVDKAWKRVLEALAEVQEQSKNLKRFGVGRTEDPTLIVARIVPRLRELSETSTLIADQLTARLRRG